MSGYHGRHNMFAPIRARSAQREEQKRRVAEAEARLNEPLTRREVVAAIESVAAGFNDSGFPEHVAVRNAFIALAEMLL